MQIHKIIAAGIFSMFMATGICSAEVVTGYAAITNGNIETAREQARNNAMRAFVEQEIGVQINSQMDVSMGMVIRDKISKESNGYVKLNRVINEYEEGGIFVSKIDVTASDTLIRIDLRDVKRSLEMLSENSNYSGVAVAVSGRDENGRVEDMARINYYVQDKIQEAGFRTVVNDTVRSYMDRTTDFSNLNVGAEIRRLARTNREAEENALVRGTLNTVDVHSVGSRYVATVNASFELVALDSNYSASFSDYFSAVGRDRFDAIANAEEIAARTASENLGRKALEYEQSKIARGIKTTIVITGISNTDPRAEDILQSLEGLRCKIGRSSFNSRGEFVIAVSAPYTSLEDLRREILRSIPSLHRGIDNETSYSEKLYFSFQ
ncbi:MAG: hypothetical protein IJ575_11030 [Selenomonadaceae bacterium]|nr:hypothetical protein [Selenomonadaceae bacterium]